MERDRWVNGWLDGQMNWPKDVRVDEPLAKAAVATFEWLKQGTDV